MTRRRRSPLYGEAGYARAEGDFYPTEPWCTYQILDALPTLSPRLVEPACGDGAIARILVERGHDVLASDLVDRGYGRAGIDFLTETDLDRRSVVTNPPYDLAEAFVRLAIALTRPFAGQALFLLPYMWDAAGGRRDLFEQPPYAGRWILTRRPNWSEQRTAGPRMPFAWFLWDWGAVAPPLSRYLPVNPEAAW